MPLHTCTPPPTHPVGLAVLLILVEFPVVVVVVVVVFPYGAVGRPLLVVLLILVELPVAVAVPVPLVSDVSVITLVEVVELSVMVTL